MMPLKLSTAITVVFFVHDTLGQAVTGIADGSFTKRISKGSGAFAAMTVTITEMENGWYSFPLSTSHSDTLGILTVCLIPAAGTGMQINLQWRIHTRLPDDLAWPTVTGRSIDTDANGGVEVGAIQNDVITAASIAVGAIAADAFAAGAIDAAALAADAVTEIQAGLAVPGSAMTLTAGERNSIATALLDLAAGVETSYTVRQTLRLMASMLLGKASGGPGSSVFRDTGDTKNRVTTVADSSGNRTTMTLDGT